MLIQRTMLIIIFVVVIFITVYIFTSDTAGCGPPRVRARSLGWIAVEELAGATGRRWCRCCCGCSMTMVMRTEIA